jgi:maltooligosyltrehalose synthase
MVVVPRFISSLIRDGSGLPLGPEVWQDTRIIQSLDSAARCYLNVFTGEILKINQKDGLLSLALADILSVFPVALLEQLDCPIEYNRSSDAE